MNNQFRNNVDKIEKYPSPQDLWKNEKSEFRHWIILFGIALLGMLSLALSSFLVNTSDKLAILNFLSDNVFVKSQTPAEDAEQYFRTYYLIYPIIQICILTLSLVLYVVSIYKSYTEKTFKHISKWSTFVVGVGAFFAGYEIVAGIFNGFANFDFEIPGVIFKVITNVLYLVIYFVSSSKIAIIRKKFFFSEYYENIRKSPVFEAMKTGDFSSMQGAQSPFGPQRFGGSGAYGTNQNHASSNTNEVNENIENSNNDKNTNHVATPLQKENPNLTKLKKISRVELELIATKLSISGFEEMSTDELIDVIFRLSDK